MQNKIDINQFSGHKGLRTKTLITRNGYRFVPGVYCITNLIDNKKYIGSTINLYDRYMDHSRKLINDYHENSYVQDAYNKHNLENFEFSILEEYPNLKNNKSEDTKEFIQYCEQFYFNSRLSAINYSLKKDKLFTKVAYNMRPCAWDATKSKISKTGSKKLSLGRKGVNSKKFYKFDLNKNQIEDYNCVTDYCIINKNFTQSKLQIACKTNSFYKGYFWSYIERPKEFSYSEGRVLIEVINTNTKEVTYYTSLRAFGKVIGMKGESLNKYINEDITIKGFKIKKIEK